MSGITLEVSGLRAGYGRRVVIEDLSLTLAAGEWFALMGPNGCGKSTLLDCIVGRLAPAAGAIRIGGHDLLGDACAAKRTLGYGAPPESLPPLLTARQCLQVHAAAKNVAIGGDLLELADELLFVPYLDEFIDTLSLGTRQKLAVLLALVGEPKLIVLDEAFNGLDPASSLVLKRHLRARLWNRGATLVLATHALDVVEHYADRAALLIDGRLVREWDKAQMDAIRTGGDGFEIALATAMPRPR